MKTLFLIKEKEGLEKDYSILYSMMTYARKTTLDLLENISIDELDFQYNKDANSIGMLLEHMIAVEKIYQKLTFESVTEDELEEFAETLEPALSLGEKANILKGRTAESYIQELDQVRQKTLEFFSTQSTKWLYEETDWWYDEKANNFFKWFHVFEDEINHRGQIRIIKKMYKNTLQNT
ncbi:putative damage-inducible protein DinB [Bacillus pakistanensis]|uniref:Damage-inducible protein DinB n=1 Tax=Rossellomorea pakistanensis TaxID=992288 RepID=A0ABS2N8I9_9BACI|nr:DinB family protein [Bacillus pakistanensis]MBM7584153.1 putative damage-inducible protein DinB [Bacillus pakistanensis]